MNTTNDCKPLKHKFQKVGQCFCGKYHVDKTGRMFRSEHYALYDNPMVTGVLKDFYYVSEKTKKENKSRFKLSK
jgi:hypothetical protein